jgi:hypothetical protein
MNAGHEMFPPPPIQTTLSRHSPGMPFRPLAYSSDPAKTSRRRARMTSAFKPLQGVAKRRSSASA